MIATLFFYFVNLFYIKKCKIYLKSSLANKTKKIIKDLKKIKALKIKLKQVSSEIS